MFRFPKASVIAVAGALLATGCGQTGTESGATASGDVSPTAAYDDSRVGYYGYGSPASPEEIAGWDIDIRPDGTGLPEGSGSVEDGEWLYDDKCAECHGTFGEGVGRFPVLAGGKGSLAEPITTPDDAAASRRSGCREAGRRCGP